MSKLLKYVLVILSFNAHLAFAAVNETSLNSIEIDNAMLRAPIPGMANTAAYMEITNNTDKNITFVSAKSDYASKVEYHDHIMKDGVMKMVKLDSLEIKSGETMKLQSGGLHMMFIGLTDPKQNVDYVNVTLITDNGAEIATKLKVKSIHQQHNQHKHH